MVLKRI